jgi:hypothetical protein
MVDGNRAVISLTRAVLLKDVLLNKHPPRVGSIPSDNTTRVKLTFCPHLLEFNPSRQVVFLDFWLLGIAIFTRSS